MVYSVNICHLFLFVSFYFTLVLCDPQPSSNNCSNWRDSFDSGSAILAGDLENFEYPSSIEGLDEIYCKKHLETIRSMKVIVKSCLKPFPQQITGMAITSSRKEIKNQCDNPNEKEKIYKSLRCFKIPEALETEKRLYKRLIRSVIYARNFISEEKDKIPFSCCSYHDFVSNSRTKLIEAGCDKDDVNYIITSNEKKVRESLDWVCSSWTSESTKCIQLLSTYPLNMKLLKNVSLHKSHVLPFMDILTDIPLPEEPTKAN